MAALAILPSSVDQSDYAVAEQKLQEHVLDIYGNRDNGYDMFRPSLADVQKVGFFSMDRSSQTYVTEIVDLKEMTEVLQVLLQDVATLRRDINFTKHVMQADYESKLQSKSLDLYCRINERVRELERIHLDRVNSLRKAFKQQLADAVSRHSFIYKKNLETKIIGERSKQQSDQKGQDVLIQELKATISRNEALIQMLQLQLQQQNHSENQERKFVLDETPVMESHGKSSSQIKQLEEEMAGMREEHEKLEKRCQQLEDTLEIREEEVSVLNKTVQKLQRQLEKEHTLNQQLKHEKEEIRLGAEKELSSSKQLLTKQKLEMEQMNSERLRLVQEEAMSAAREEVSRMQAKEQSKIKELMDQKKELEKLLAMERSRKSDKIVKEEAGNESSKSSDSQMKNQIKQLKAEINRIHRTWEKKFSILQASMHALKDESYIRQTLQRQAVTLHQASVSYATDIPLSISSSAQGSLQRKFLPDIQKSGRSLSHRHEDKDFISYTVSLASGRGTAAMSMEDNQVMSDTEQDLPSDYMPIPEPPARLSQNSPGENSHPCTSPAVVLMPATPL